MDSKSSGTSRCSAVSSGVEDPPGVQNFSSWPLRIPPHISSNSRSVIPSGASYWPGRSTWPESEKMPYPVDFSRSEEHTSELQSRGHLLCRLLLEKKKFPAH